MEIFVKLILLIGLFNVCQDNIIIRLEGKPDVFTCDDFDHVYTYSNHVLRKFDSEGRLEANYSSMFYGSISSVDVSDPMRIVVFCKEFNTVLLLDKKLNLIGEAIRMDAIGFSSAACVCKSRQNGIWIFDSYTKKLVLYHLGSKSILREIDLEKYSDAVQNVDNLIESRDRVYFYKKGFALMAIGQFGGRLEILDIYPSNTCQVKENQILYTDSEHLFSFNFENFETKIVEIEGFDSFDDIKLGCDKVFVLKNDTVQIRNK